MAGKWMLICYGEWDGNEIKGELVITLLPDLIQSLKLVENKYYCYESFLIAARNIDHNGNGDIDFVVFNRTTQENIAEIEYWPEGYTPTSMSDLINELTDLGCEFNELDIDKAQ